MPFPTLRNLPDPGIQLVSLVCPILAGRFFTTIATTDSHLREVTISIWDDQHSEPGMIDSKTYINRKLIFNLTVKITVKKKKKKQPSLKSTSEGFPWWLSGKESVNAADTGWITDLEDSRCHRENKPVHYNYKAHKPQLLKPKHLEPVLHKRSHHNGKPTQCN